jgi:3,4-dihydroxy 2-butanone 4-phosphate synthase/GTP cyclohydrolase II
MAVDKLERLSCARIPTAHGEFELCIFRQPGDEKQHLAMISGQVSGQSEVLVRVHSECFTGDVMGSLRCDCGQQLVKSMEKIAAAGRGVILYLRQEGRGIGLHDKLRAYNLQDEGYDTVDANLMLGHEPDERDYQVAAAMLSALDIKSILLLTNNPNKIEQLRDYGVTVEARVPLEIKATAENKAYLEAKSTRLNHLLHLDADVESSIELDRSRDNGRPD